jgi:hypothetical protein
MLVTASPSSIIIKLWSFMAGSHAIHVCIAARGSVASNIKKNIEVDKLSNSKYMHLLTHTRKWEKTSVGAIA